MLTRINKYPNVILRHNIVADGYIFSKIQTQHHSILEDFL